MRKRILIALFFIVPYLVASVKYDSKWQDSSVFICNGPESKRFHNNPSCRGLSSCSTQIYKVSISKAQKLGRTPCKICY